MEILHSVGAGRAQQSCRRPSLVLTFLGRAVTEGEPQVAATDFLYGNGHLQGRARWQHSIFPVPSHPQHLLVLRDCWLCMSHGSSTKAGARQVTEPYLDGLVPAGLLDLVIHHRLVLRDPLVASPGVDGFLWTKTQGEGGKKVNMEDSDGKSSEGVRGRPTSCRFPSSSCTDMVTSTFLGVFFLPLSNSPWIRVT